ncbi:MAG: glycosyltransferase family A protein [Desulfuromonadales bacterium]
MERQLKVSVVIPCFNQGAYVEEAVKSVLLQSFDDYEIIIVNDGSTDVETNRILSGFENQKIRVLHTENMGLASARNNGIREARGTYILPLDADDRIGPTYLEKAVDYFDRMPDVGIVYCYAEFFGDRQGQWYMPEFSLRWMLFSNLIFCSAFFRKDDWERAGGYNPNMSRGLEDWDFWLAILELGKGVYCIPDVLFYYRVREESMLRSMNRDVHVEMHLQIMRNHPQLFIDHIQPLLVIYYRLLDSSLYVTLKRLNLFSFIWKILRHRS